MNAPIGEQPRRAHFRGNSLPPGKTALRTRQAPRGGATSTTLGAVASTTPVEARLDGNG